MKIEDDKLLRELKYLSKNQYLGQKDQGK